MLDIKMKAIVKWRATFLKISRKMEVAQEARKTLLQKIIHAQEERARVARELHDETNQCLSSINLGLDQICEEDEVAKSKHLSRDCKKLSCKQVEI